MLRLPLQILDIRLLRYPFFAQGFASILNQILLLSLLISLYKHNLFDHCCFEFVAQCCNFMWPSWSNSKEPIASIFIMHISRILAKWKGYSFSQSSKHALNLFLFSGYEDPAVLKEHFVSKDDYVMLSMILCADNGESKVPGDWYFQEACGFDTNF